MIVLLYAKCYNARYLRIDRKLKRANQVKCRKQSRPSQLILVTFPRENALGESRISADVVGNTRTVLGAISDRFVRPTMLVILAESSVVLVFPRLARAG